MRKQMPRSQSFFGGHMRRGKVKWALRTLGAMLSRREQHELRELQGDTTKMFSWKRQWVQPEGLHDLELLAWQKRANDRLDELLRSKRRFRKYKRAAARRGVDFEDYVIWLADQKLHERELQGVRV